jgi:2,4-dienoyl-CoA reductase (NADPH2)
MKVSMIGRMFGRARFASLMEPGAIGVIRTRNRIIKNGTHLFYHDKPGGYMDQRNIDFYDVLARGGVGLIVVASAPLGLEAPIGYRIDRDEYIPGFSELARTIHKYKCPAFVQMFHLGPMQPSFLPGRPAAASSLPRNESPRPQFERAHELTIPEISDIVEEFAKGAVRIRRAGFDGIELNSATNHLLNSFLSRAWNRRHDAYGCDSLESRARIVVEIIGEVKRRNGRDFAVIALINGVEPGLRSGITYDESRGIARILEAAGADAIEVRAEFYSRPEDDRLRYSTHFPEIYFYPEPPRALGARLDGSHHGAGITIPIAAEIKKSVSVPVIAVGRLDPQLGERAIRRGVVDFISLNRRLLADPELPNKVAAGRMEDIAPCTACISCFDFGEHGQPVYCRVNAALGREREYEIKPAESKKRVMVIGGGPAGMEAARVAALRGHAVMLYERERRLGGALPIAAVVKGSDREDLGSLIRYLETQITKLGVSITLGTEVTRSLVEQVKPDVLVVAAGGVHDVPHVPGLDRHNVVTSRDLHRTLKTYLRFFSPALLRWLTRFWMPLGKRVIVVGGGVQGCQVAEFLVMRGRRVTIVDTASEIGEGLLETLIKPYLLNWLIDKEVVMMPGVTYEEITDKGLTVTTKDGIRKTLEADTIVTALPMRPNADLLVSLKGSVPVCYAIGDARAPNMIIDAIADGSRIARAI